MSAERGRPHPETAPPRRGIPTTPCTIISIASWDGWRAVRLRRRAARELDAMLAPPSCCCSRHHQVETVELADVDVYRVTGLCLDWPQREAAGRAGVAA